MTSADSSTTPGPAAARARTVILTVDDDPGVSRAVARDLRRRYGGQHRIVRAESGADALEALRQMKLRGEQTAVILADFRMPEMNGIEFLEHAMDVYPGARRALLTAYADTSAAIDAINVVDLDYYLLKPWDPPEEKLYPVVDALLDAWLTSDHRPVPEIKVVGHRWSARSSQTREFLARNQVPYRWYPADEPEGRRLLGAAHTDDLRLPVVITPEGDALIEPSETELADRVGLATTPSAGFYDLVVRGLAHRDPRYGGQLPSASRARARQVHRRRRLLRVGADRGDRLRRPRHLHRREQLTSRFFVLDAPKFAELMTNWFPMATHLLEGLFFGQKNTQEAIGQRERLLALGSLSAGLTHELNNPASAAVRATSSLRERVAGMRAKLASIAAGPVDRAALANLIAFQDKAVERVCHTTQLSPLEASDREDELTDWLTDHDINRGWELASVFAQAGLDTSWLHEAADAVAHESDGHASLDGALRWLGYTVETEPIPVYSGELNQVWTNLVDNAASAMDGAGTLTVRTRQDDGHAVIEFGDTGEGVPAELRERIFEPFFTTKPVGQGTGLGLDISWRIVVNRHHGDLRVESEPGNTRFFVRLPLTAHTNGGTT